MAVSAENSNGETKKSARGRMRQRKSSQSSSDNSSDSSSGSSSSGDSGSSSSSDSSSSSSPPRTRGHGGEQERKSSPSPRGRRQSGGDGFPRRSRSPRKGQIRREKRSPTPKPTKIHIGNLTKNINKEHIAEIFQYYGSIKSVKLPTELSGFPRCLAYVEYEDHTQAEKSMKYMDGAQLDGQVITVQFVFPVRRRALPQRQFSPPRGRGRWRQQPPAWRRSPPRRPRMLQRSPQRRRSPIRDRRRRRSRSSSTESR